jgi:hypothetical protein
VEKRGLPRLFWTEAEFHQVLREAELRYVRELVDDIENGTLGGLAWWREAHGPDGGAAVASSLLEDEGWKP